MLKEKEVKTYFIKGTFNDIIAIGMDFLRKRVSRFKSCNNNSNYAQQDEYPSSNNLFLCCRKSRNNVNNVWYLDSRSSNHISSNLRKYFQILMMFLDPILVLVITIQCIL